jgi:predicted secreted protein
MGYLAKATDMPQEEFEDTKGVIRISKSKKDIQYNGKKKKDKSTNNNLQNITHSIKDRKVVNVPCQESERLCICV